MTGRIIERELVGNPRNHSFPTDELAHRPSGGYKKLLNLDHLQPCPPQPNPVPTRGARTHSRQSRVQGLCMALGSDNYLLVGQPK